jgi:hypothetical protein
MGPRLLRRPEPRFSISLAAGGVVLAIVGVLVWGIGYLASGLHVTFGTDGEGAAATYGESRRFLGAVLSLALVAAGYAVVIIRRRGPLATAGVVASAVGVPLTIGFLSLDIGVIFTGSFPISIDAVFLVSIIVWLISYFAVPGAQGRSFYLGLAALYLASYVEFKIGQNALLRSAASTVSNGSLSSGGSGTGDVAAVGLIFGLGYYGIGALLDKRGRNGAAVALVVAGFFTTVGGVVAAASSFGQAGTGVLLVVLGSALGWYGGHFGRRFTAWAWTVGLVLGIGLIVAKIIPHSTTGAGIVFIVVGVAVVIAAQAIASATKETPDIEAALAQPSPAPV